MLLLGCPFEFFGLALGLKHSCAIRENFPSVVCWGGREFSFNSNSTGDEDFFESMVASQHFTCGLIRNFSLICWGPGWSSSPTPPLPKIVGGPYVKQGTCPCSYYPGSANNCVGSDGGIFDHCLFPPPPPPPPQQQL